MPAAGFVLGFADFSLALPISEIANMVSRTVFGGIPFIEREDDGTGVPTMRLAAPFLGMTADLFGCEDHYTIELNTLISATVPNCHVVCDLSPMLIHQVRRIAGVTILTLTP